MADSASDKQRLKTAAESIWRSQQMSTQSVASALMDLIARYVNGEGRQAAEIATIQKRVEELEQHNATLIQCRQELLGVGVRAREALVEITRRMEEEKALLDWWIENSAAGIAVDDRAERTYFAVYYPQKITPWFEDPRQALAHAAHNAAKEP